MAQTEYGVNHPLAVKAWSRKLFQEALKECWASKFMGKTSSSLVQIKDEVEKGPGDRIRIGLRMQLTGAGVQGDATLEGNEESLVTYYDDLIINQLRHAVRSQGKMSEQRIPFSVRDESYQGLKDWYADRLDTWLMNQIGGNASQTDTRYTGNNSAVEPDTSHVLLATGTAGTDLESSLSASSTFSLTMIDRAVTKAKTFTTGSNPIIRPLKVNGADKYVCFIHPFQHYQLRQNTASGQYLDIQKAAITGGQIGNNPIYTGAIAEYNGTVIHESPRMPTGLNAANARRAVFCGAQAAIMGFGQDNGPDKMSWVEELFDYNNELGVSCGWISGLKKSRFNSADFGTIVLSSYAVSP